MSPLNHNSQAEDDAREDHPAKCDHSHRLRSSTKVPRSGYEQLVPEEDSASDWYAISAVCRVAVDPIQILPSERNVDRDRLHLQGPMMANEKMALFPVQRSGSMMNGKKKTSKGWRLPHLIAASFANPNNPSGILNPITSHTAAAREDKPSSVV
jgi:hypothetical protein